MIHHVQAKSAQGAASVVLDSKSLLIRSITDEIGSSLEYELGQKHDIFGVPITVKFKPIKQGEIVKVKIFYETTQDCSALQWLTPEQTVGLKYPYMFSQCQAIHAR